MIIIKNGLLAIFDYELDYANNLMDYMNRRGKLSLQISAFSDIECLMEYLEHNVVDILLMAEQTKTVVERVENHVKNIYILSEGQTVRENTTYKSIYKFQSADNILEEVLELYSKENGEAPSLIQIERTKNQYVIGVFSPKGGSKKTTFAMALSQCYGTHKKTLYINLELFTKLSWLSEEDMMGFSELLYYIKQKAPNLMMKIDSYIHSGNHFDYILPVRHYQDLFEMNQEDVSYFLHYLKAYSDYEVIIIDIGIFSEGILQLLYLCDKIYLPREEDPMSQDKNEAFYQQLREEKEDGIIERIEEIRIPYDAELANGFYSLENLTGSILSNYISSLLEEA